MAGMHNKIIAQAAKAALGPLGFRRKGRSRTWIADHGWWATIVEFQPSSWSKGSHLNVAAHWLWADHDHISFDYGGRVNEHIEYHSDQQFGPEAAQLAARAVAEALTLAGHFASLETTAAHLVGEVRTHSLGDWPAYHAGVAAGLAGFSEEAIDMFARRGTRRLDPAPQRMADLGNNPLALRTEVLALIARHRKALKLPVLSEEPV